MCLAGMMGQVSVSPDGSSVWNDILAERLDVELSFSIPRWIVGLEPTAMSESVNVWVGFSIPRWIVGLELAVYRGGQKACYRFGIPRWIVGVATWRALPHTRSVNVSVSPDGS